MKKKIFYQELTLQDIKDIKQSGLIIGAIIEDLEIKEKIFKELENLVDKECIIASNTSSLSIASIGERAKEQKEF